MNRVEPNRNVYVGHRYVPLLVGEWDKSIQYEGLSIVTFQGASYTSKKMTPPGIDIENEEYWVVTGNYNAQVEYYRQDVQRVQEDISELDNRLTKDLNDTREYVDDEIDELNTNVNTRLNGMKDDVEEVEKNLNKKVDKDNKILNVKDFGASGDGVTDDTEFFKSAINELNNGGTIYIPSGVYPISETLNIPSNLTIKGMGKDSVIHPVNNDTVFNIEGNVSNEIPINSEVEMFSDTLYLNNHGLGAGDHVLITSQRDALDENDSGKQYTMGTRTGSFTAYLGEFNRVRQSFTERIVLKRNTMFPVYKPNNSSETSPFSRNSTTVQKVNFKENIILKDFSFSRIVNNTINVKFGNNVLIENVDIYDDSYDWGGIVDFILFDQSYNCKAKNCHFEFKDTVYPDNYYNTNVYKIRSSQQCGFDGCYSLNAGQSVDITFQRDTIISSNNYVTNCTIENSGTSGIITHGGVYQTKITNNNVIGCPQGIYIRSRNSLVTGNMLHNGNPTVGTSTNNYGLGIYDRWAVDCVFTGNTVIGFLYGLAVVDSSDSPFEYVGLMASNNTFKDFKYGVYINRNSNNETKVNTGVNISNNVFMSNGTTGNNYGVYLRPYVQGFTLIGNQFSYYGDVDGTGVYQENNCHLNTYKDNTFNGYKDGMRLGNRTNVEYFEEVSNGFMFFTVDNNRFIEAEREYVSSFYVVLNAGEKPLGSIQMNPTPGSIAKENSIFVSNSSGILHFRDENGVLHNIVVPE